MSLTLLSPAREAARRWFFSEATASAADDTLRKPLSRLLCVTLTVMQTNRQTQTHSTHTLLLVELAKKIKKAQFSNVWKMQIFVLLFQSGRKGSFFLGFTGHSCSNCLYYLLSQAHVHGGGSRCSCRGVLPCVGLTAPGSGVWAD